MRAPCESTMPGQFMNDGRSVFRDGDRCGHRQEAATRFQYLRPLVVLVGWTRHSEVVVRVVRPDLPTPSSVVLDLPRPGERRRRRRRHRYRKVSARGPRAARRDRPGSARVVIGESGGDVGKEFRQRAGRPPSLGQPVARSPRQHPVVHGAILGAEIGLEARDRQKHLRRGAGVDDARLRAEGGCTVVGGQKKEYLESRRCVREMKLEGVNSPLPPCTVPVVSEVIANDGVNET